MGTLRPHSPDAALIFNNVGFHIIAAFFYRFQIVQGWYFSNGACNPVIYLYKLGRQALPYIM